MVQPIPPIEVSYHSARARALLSFLGETTVGFEWGDDAENLTEEEVLTSSGDFDAVLENLSPDTEYFYKPFYVSQGDRFYGDIFSFTTKALSPAKIKTSDLVNNLGFTTASVKGELIGLGGLGDCDVYVDYGIGSLTDTEFVGNFDSLGVIEYDLSGLQDGEGYSFRFRTSNAIGDYEGSVENFNTYADYGEVTICKASYNYAPYNRRFLADRTSSDILHLSISEISNIYSVILDERTLNPVLSDATDLIGIVSEEDELNPNVIDESIYFVNYLNKTDTINPSIELILSGVVAYKTSDGAIAVSLDCQTLLNAGIINSSTIEPSLELETSYIAVFHNLGLLQPSLIESSSLKATILSDEFILIKIFDAYIPFVLIEVDIGLNIEKEIQPCLNLIQQKDYPPKSGILIKHF